MVLFGGTGAKDFADTWTWSGTNWTKKTPAASPTARRWAAMTYDPATSQLVLFGGYGNNGFGVDAVLGDTWTWTGTSWTKQSPAVNPARAVYAASIAYDPAYAQPILFGGDGDGGYVNDMSSWNGSYWPSPDVYPVPSARASASMADDPATGQVILFGGDASGGGNLGDTWALPAANTAGPTFTLQPIAHLVTPGIVTGIAGGSTPFSQDQYQTPAIQKWSAADPSGICKYQLYNDSGRSEPTLLYQGMNTSYQFETGDPEEDSGGYNTHYFVLRVQSCSGHWSTSNTFDFPSDRYIPQVVQVNDVTTHDDSEATYSTGWTAASCLCFIDGTNMHASTAGASATFSYTGNAVGWVSETGPTRGSAKIYQDGVLMTTVSTYAAANTGAQVMWTNWFAAPGQHTIRIVVAGTAGHPRVDVDGFLLEGDPNA